MSLYFLGIVTGLLIVVIVYCCIEFPIRLSSVKRFLPWVKPAQVIQVDFINKRRINN